MSNIVLAISGASGAIYGIRLLEALSGAGIKVHLIVSNWAKKTIAAETDYSMEQVAAIAEKLYHEEELGAAISSGSFLHDGMVVAPCSMKTLAGIACGFDENLIVRAADVTLKEQRRLVLLPRETPLTAIHLENMLKLSRMGVVIMPPVPGFYNRPQSLDDIVNHTVSRALDHLRIENHLSPRWEGEAVPGEKNQESTKIRKVF